MPDKPDISKNTRHASRASFACVGCKKAKRRCDISQQAESSGSCTTCRLRNEKCDFRLYGQDRRKQRQSTKALQTRVAVLENELKTLSSRNASPDTLILQRPDIESSTRHDEPPLNTHKISKNQCTSKSPDHSIPIASNDPSVLECGTVNPKTSTNSFSAVSLPQSFLGLRTPSRSFVASPTSACSWDSARTTTSAARATRRFPIGMDEVTPPAGACKDQDYGNTRYLGESSMFPYGERQQRSSPEGGIAAHVLRNREMSPSSLQDFIEPEPVVDHLLELFWKFQASHIVIVDPIIFLRHRQQAHENGGNGDRKFYTPCLLYSMLALASLIAPEKGVKRYATERGNVGDRFHRRARALFDMEMESPVVTTVQAAVLIGSWYGTFVDNSLGWIFSGIGFRMATKLGLHLDCSRMLSNGRMTDEEATYRSVAFWGCYIEDKLYSAYCQRPTMLMDWDITISPPEERPMTDPYMPPNLLPHTVALAQICGRTLLALYAQRHFNDVNENLKRIASEIHGQLWEWQRKLPHDLEWPADDQSSPSPPSVLVLHMEFYYNLILVHRPLLEFSKARDELSQDASHINSTTTCMMAAANITKLIHVYSQRYNIRQISPNGVHMAFIAATIHLINYRLTNVESHNRLLFMSVAALTELGDSYAMARKAVKILKSLIEGFRPLDEVSSQEGETTGDSIPRTGNHPEERNDSLAKDGGLSSNHPSFSVVPGVSSTQPPSDILTWKMQMCPDISFDFEVPLEIPQPMDVEGLVDQQHHERQSEQLSEPHPKAGGALYDVTAGIPWYGQTGTDFGDFDFGDLASSVNDTFALNMEDRDLFHTFYGAASSLY